MKDLRVDKVIVEVGFDEDFDPETQLELKEDKEAVRSGKIIPLYVKAEAEVSYSIGSGSRRLEWLSSSGLYGILVESQRDPYLKEVIKDQITDLKEHLKIFNIPTTNIESKVTVQYK